MLHCTTMQCTNLKRKKSHFLSCHEMMEQCLMIWIIKSKCHLTGQFLMMKMWNCLCSHLRVGQRGLSWDGHQGTWGTFAQFTLFHGRPWWTNHTPVLIQIQMELDFDRKASKYSTSNAILNCLRTILGCFHCSGIYNTISDINEWIRRTSSQHKKPAWS